MICPRVVPVIVVPVIDSPVIVVPVIDSPMVVVGDGIAVGIAGGIVVVGIAVGIVVGIVVVVVVVVVFHRRNYDLLRELLFSYQKHRVVFLLQLLKARVSPYPQPMLNPHRHQIVFLYHVDVFHL
jgi:hypothetical protein